MSRKRKKWLTMKVVNKKKSLPAPKKNQRCSQPITTSPPMFTLPRLICKVTHRTSQIFKEMMRMMIQKSNNRTIVSKLVCIVTVVIELGGDVNIFSIYT